MFRRFVARPSRAVLMVGMLVLGPASPPARAQTPTPPALHLDSLLAEVAAANPSLRAARLEAAARAQRAPQVGALPDPQVSLMVAALPVLTAYGAQRSQWRVEQPMPWPGTLRLRREAAEHGAEAARWAAEALALDLALAVRQAYYHLYQIQQTDALLAAFERRLGAFAEAATVRYEVGRGPQGAVLQVGLERDRLRARRLGLRVQEAAARQTLARLTDRPTLALGPVRLEPPAPPQAVDALVDAALDDAALDDAALDQRPELRALEAELAEAQTDVALARKAFYPDLGAGLVYTDIAARDAPPTADGTDALGLMVSARVPLQRARLKARLQEARLRAEQVEARRRAVVASIRTDLAEARYAAERENETVALFREQLLPQARATVESVLAAYTTGAADYDAVLDAERAQFQIQLGLEEAIGRSLAARATLERALGYPRLDTTSDRTDR